MVQNVVFLMVLYSFVLSAQSVTLDPDKLTSCTGQGVVKIQTDFGSKQTVKYTAVIGTDVDNNSCPANGDSLTKSEITDDDGLLQITQSSILNIEALKACTGNGISNDAIICLYGPKNKTLKGLFRISTTPNNISVSGLSEGNKRVSFDINDSKDLQDTGYEICFGTDEAKINAVTGIGACTENSQTKKGSKAINLTNVENGQTYYLKARVADGGSNSPWSSIAGPVTPDETLGFGAVYDGVENPLSYGCAQSSGSSAEWVILMMLVVLLNFFRGNPPQPSFKKGGRGLLIAFMLLLSPNLLARPGQINFGVVGAPYRPNLNESTRSDGSYVFPFYKCMFEDRLMPLMGLEFDVHVLDKFGSLQLGMGASYSYAGGYALKKGFTSGDDCQHSSDTVGLHLFQFRPQITYVMDTWVDTVPLVPYFRFSIVAQNYYFLYQDHLDRHGNDKPVGFIFGFQAAAGLMLAMDFMEPPVSRRAKANGVYDHIYLKTEVAYSPINNFFSKGLDFSPAWPASGFPLLLTFGIVFELQ